MTCSVNLVPEKCLAAALRAGRQRRWSVAIIAVGACLAVSWTVIRIEQNSSSTERQLAQLQEQALATQVALSAEIKKARQLQVRAEQLLALRPAYSLATQLVRLGSAIPEGIMMTQLFAGPESRPESTNVAATAKPAIAPALPQIERPPNLRVEIHGLALQHEASQEFLKVLEQIPGWERVEPGSLKTETFHDVPMAGFVVQCAPVRVAK